MKKQFVKEDKKGRKELWEWDETPETLKALKELHETVKKTREKLDSL